MIVPAHNAAATLDDQLAALAGQDFDGPWEVVVVDHESTDGTGDLARRWQAVMPHVRVLPTRAPRGVAHPRNVGAGAAAGNRILICDADDIVAPDWVSQLVDGLRTYDVVTGPLDRALLNDPEHHAWMAPEPAPVDGRPPPDYGYLPYPSGGNMGVRRPVLEALRGFDPSVSGKEDIDFDWRAIEAGYTIGFVPGAVIHYRMRGDLFGAARQRFYRAQAEPLLYRRYRRAACSASRCPTSGAPTATSCTRCRG